MINLNLFIPQITIAIGVLIPQIAIAIGCLLLPIGGGRRTILADWTWHPGAITGCSKCGAIAGCHRRGLL